MGKKVPRVVRRREGRSVEEIVGERVRTLREGDGRSLREVARSASISMTTVSLVEQGKIAATLPTLDALAIALGVPLANLFKDVPSPPARTKVERQTFRRLMASLSQKDDSFLRTLQRIVSALEAQDGLVKRSPRRSRGSGSVE